MLRYPNLHTSLVSTLAGSTVRRDEEGSSRATVKRWHLKSRRAYLVAATLVIIAAGSFLGAYAFHLFGSQTPNCWTRPPDALNTAVFTVVMANEGVNVGFNGSAYHPTPWPVMNVTLGQIVIIHVINNDKVQATCFQLIQYYDSRI